MSEIKKVFIKILLLVLDILVFGWNTFRRIILPGRNRKGNILSSLFIFFAGIIDRLNYFQHGTFNMASFTRKRYVRQSILIVGSILFLLSLLEWSGNQKLSYSPIKYAEQLSTTDSDTISIDQSEKVARCPADVAIKITYRETRSTTYPPFTFTTSVKKYLLIRYLRI
ncbi:MAG: hypothetical protein M3Z26_08890 [Bacteroidota bacterium]|nr:hypothetical protein [Bacteroidota bacterium]